jgi:hypothetical protein
VGIGGGEFLVQKSVVQVYRRQQVNTTRLVATNQSVAGSGTGRAAGVTA